MHHIHDKSKWYCGAGLLLRSLVSQACNLVVLPTVRSNLWACDHFVICASCLAQTCCGAALSLGTGLLQRSLAMCLCFGVCLVILFDCHVFSLAQTAET